MDQNEYATWSLRGPGLSQVPLPGRHQGPEHRDQEHGTQWERVANGELQLIESTAQSLLVPVKTRNEDSESSLQIQFRRHHCQDPWFRIHYGFHLLGGVPG